ncbi:MAG: aminotransferase class V-fold PLP-dependent enzyme [Verrucomicrobia bacterium]|nr:MAG: aminotransferase class V-fold PLP-dependent enzyme [Verrucomicrobiota bacterium]
MELDRLLQDESLRRREFPVAAERVFLAHAAVAPLPDRVRRRMQNHLDAACRDDQEAVLGEGFFRETRALAARLLGVEPAEVALLGPTSTGLSLVAEGLPFNAGDNVLVCREDYPSNVYPWLGLRRRGVEVRYLRSSRPGCVTAEEVLAQVDERTRLVSLASCHFVTGWRPDIDAIGRELHARGVWFCVDGIQTLGAFPTPLAHVDFLAADAHKWLLGPGGAGVFYVRREVQEDLRPVLLGWHNVRCPDFVALDQLDLRSDARRYEPGTANVVGLVGLRAALELLLEVGLDAIAVELLRKRRRLIAGLHERGMELLLPDAPETHASAIVSFRPRNETPESLHQRLTAAGFVVSLRTMPGAGRWIRLSPHFYNTDEELDRLLAFLG